MTTLNTTNNKAPSKSPCANLRSGLSSGEIQQGANQKVFIKLPAVKERTTLSTSEIYRRLEAGTFPQQIRLGAKAVAWLEHEIDEWIEQTIAAGRPADGVEA